MKKEKFFEVCNKHYTTIVYYDGKECPLCVAERRLEELDEMLDSAEDKLETATAGAPGSY